MLGLASGRFDLFFCNQKTAYEMRISDWSSDVCSSDLAIALLKTNARSPYFFNFHKGDLGHTLIIGPSGGGKTVLLNFLMAQTEKTGARQIFIDKDRGAQIFVQASGGTYLALHNGVPTAFSPLKALADRKSTSLNSSH